MANEYWRTKLNHAEKKLYDNMVFAFARQEEQVSCDNFAPDVIKRIYEAVCDDHPELFHLPYNPCLQQIRGPFGTNTTLNIHNVFSAAQIRKMNQWIESVYSKLTAQLSGVNTELEKERGVCEYLLDNTVYEINNLYHQNAATVLCDGKGQCSGIARAVKLLLNRFGIEAIVVNGTASDVSKGTSGLHAWNIVKIDGDFFHLDVTFMLGGNSQKSKPYRFIYCNYSDEKIRKDHSWDESRTPNCPKTLQASNTAEGSKSAEIVISSLFELRSGLKKAVTDRANCFMFESKIQLPAEKLMSAVQKCCRDVMSSLGQAISMRISIQCDMVTISW